MLFGGDGVYEFSRYFRPNMLEYLQTHFAKEKL